MTPVVIVSDHPAVDRGYATQGRQIADHLHATGRWAVHYLGRLLTGADRARRPYPVHSAGGGRDVDGAVSLIPLLDAVLADARGRAAVPVLVIGQPHQHAPLLASAAAAGLRDRIHYVMQLPVDTGPLPAGWAATIAAADTLVASTDYGRRLVAACCARADLTPPPTSVIGLGVDTEVFRPPDAARRAAMRRELFGVDDADVLVGFFARNVARKRPDLAMQIFAMVRRGDFGWCRRCTGVTQHRFDPLSGTRHAVAVCRSCGGGLDPARARPTARLYLHTELVRDERRWVAGGVDVERLQRHLGIEGSATLQPALDIGRGVPREELAELMGCCDVHLLPYAAGSWELTVLETGACGVANVITAAGAPPEYAAPFSEVVSAASWDTHHGGMVTGVIDVERAVAALDRLVDDPVHRQALGDAGPAVARRYDVRRIGEQWDRLLRESIDGEAGASVRSVGTT